MDPGFEAIRTEVNVKLGQGQFAPAVKSDVAAVIGDEPSLAQRLDEQKYPGLPPVTSYVARTVFWHTLAYGDSARGITAEQLKEWYVLAWDAFRAPRFPSDEALKLARVVGLDYDQQVKNRVCESKGDDVVLWDSLTRHRAGKLGPVSGDCMLDTLHWAAKVAREQNTGAANSLIETAHLKEDPTFLTALEAMLNVLPPSLPSSKKKPDAVLSGAANDFQALERLRKLAFSETAPAPKVPEQMALVLDQENPAGEEEG
jgi:hypothetical protein